MSPSPVSSFSPPKQRLDEFLFFSELLVIVTVYLLLYFSDTLSKQTGSGVRTLRTQPVTTYDGATPNPGDRPLSLA